MKRISHTLTIILLLVLSHHRVSAQHVWTQHNNQERTGWYQSESVLDHTNVNKNTFGLKFTLTTDDMVLCQPLIMMNVTLPNGVGSKNVVLMATANNSIFCYDADKNGNAYWTRNYTNVNNLGGGARVANAADMHPSLCYYGYNDINGNIGINGTPVIDSTTNTMYFVTKVVKGNNTAIDNLTPAQVQAKLADTNGKKSWVEYYYPSTGFHQYLHAIDITNGNERPNSPVEIQASVPGTGDNQLNGNGRVYFEPRRNFQHTGLALANGKVYIGFGAHCDFNPSHGWMMAYDKTTLVQTAVYTPTANSGRGGIWMAGGAPAVDAAGHIYFSNGNALDEDVPTKNAGDIPHQHNIYPTIDPTLVENRGQSVIELNADLSMQSYFTPNDYKFDNDGDLDFGQPVMIIPGPGKTVLTGVKYFKMYVMNQNALGGYDPATDHVVQTIGLGNQTTGHSNFSYFGGAQAFAYQSSEYSPITAYPVSPGGTLGAGIQGNQAISNPTGLAGAYTSVSSNGIDPNTAILWSYMPNGCANITQCTGVLRALNAVDVTQELYNSTMNAADAPVGYAKFVAPTIARGNVYIPSVKNKIYVYGLTANNNCSQNVALGKNASSDGSDPAYPPSLAIDGDAGTRWVGNNQDNNYLQVDLGAQYDICKITATFEAGGYPKAYAFQVSVDGSTWTDASRVTNYDGTGLYQEISGTFTGRYVRFQGITRAATTYGTLAYQIYEFQVFGSPAASCGTPANIVSTPVNDSTETITWAAVPGATSYTFQYHYTVSSWITKTVTSPTVTITHLACNANYSATVQAVCAAGNSAATAFGFTTAACAASSCDALPTRNFSADFGDIGARGSICRQSSDFTITGSGSGVDGTADQFRMYWIDLNGDFSDHSVLAQFTSQDPGSSNGKFGIMIRQELTDVSPYVYLASVNNGQSLVFQYRKTSGGPVTTVPLVGHSLPYFLEITKNGADYIGSGSTDGVNWTILTGPTTIGTFGSDQGIPSIYGVAITSSANPNLATGIFNSFDIPSSTPLPIRLTSFKATNVDNDHVIVSWTTTMEQNVDHYELQRAGTDGVFRAIGEVGAVGNSDVPNNYTFTDKSPLTGTNYYRLKEIDLDNKTYLSPIVHVDLGAETDLQVFPNPVTTYVTITSHTDPLVEAELYDVSGKVLQAARNTGGIMTMTLNTGSLAKGMYIVHAKTKTNSYQQKIFKK